VRLELARAHLALGEVRAARTLHSEARTALARTPNLGLLTGQAAELGNLLQAAESPEAGSAWSLTTAELRLLPLLTTHLTFREIGERLYVTRNTVKTQAMSIYRKLGVSSRNEAVKLASELGLMEAIAAPQPRDVTPLG
jgi:LuxR family maltose regulon positive regulatory protein